MPPKPFIPPRPSGSGSSSSKRYSHPRTSSSSTSITKSKPKPKPAATTKSRLSNASRVELSPMTSDSEPGSEQDEEMEVDDDSASNRFENSSSRRRSNLTNRDSDAEADNEDQEDNRREHIPEALLSVLLHEFFKQEGTRLSKGATAALGMYMETFVREAVARAAWAREEAGTDGLEGGGFLEVEDLEKLAPQLLLDF